MSLYLVTYEYAVKTKFDIIVKKITTKTFRYSELENIDKHIESHDNYIRILSCYELQEGYQTMLKVNNVFIKRSKGGFEVDWVKAEQHIRELKVAYEEIGAVGQFGLYFINELISRLDKGERTQELYGEIMECN